MFCGGGGESTGIAQAAKQYHFDIKLSAINHWKRAIETHAANYPFADHYEEPVQNLDPTKVVPGGKLDLLWASPECTHHSNARGGRPRKRSRFTTNKRRKTNMQKMTIELTETDEKWSLDDIKKED